MTTTPISTFTVPVTFRGVAYDVEITPLVNGSALPFAQGQIDLWNGAEKTHRLFSKKIEKMLEKAEVPIDLKSTVTAGSKDGFTFADASTTAHKTSDRWDKFINCLVDPASHIAGRPEVNEEEDSVEEIGPGAKLRFTHNLYRSLSPENQQQVQFAVFKKKCREHFCEEHQIQPTKPITYDEFEEGCLDVLLCRNPSQPKMKPEKELRALWDMQVGKYLNKAREAAQLKMNSLRSEIQTTKDSLASDQKECEALDKNLAELKKELDKWSLAFDRIGKEIAREAEALEEASESSIEDIL